MLRSTGNAMPQSISTLASIAPLVMEHCVEIFAAPTTLEPDVLQEIPLHPHANAIVSVASCGNAWFVAGFVKYHRTVSTYINALIQAGFHVERVEEPEATSEAVEVRPDLAEERRRPPFLIMKARRE